MTGEALPTGTPTFLFTDIEGSTRLLEQLGAVYKDTLDLHHRLLTAAFTANGGIPLGTEGDSFFVVFAHASSAVAAAADVQRALAGATWPQDRMVRVRIGIHTGEADVVGDSYVGMAVHVAARVSAAGHGGQVLLTDITAQLAGGPPTVALGCHRLKDVGDVHLLQLCGPGLGSAFPPVRSLSSQPNNLPAAVDVFVGRQMELAEIRSALGECRLVTLTGPGGSGKTRLALEAAAALLPTFADGVWFVPLATAADGTRLGPVVAHALHVQDRPDEPLLDTVTAWLRDREVLLILDNCEHLVEAVGDLTQHLLAACPKLRIVATSREFLGVRGERAMRTPPLGVPDDPTLAGMSDAVELFLMRAAASAPNFDPGRADLGVVAQLCRRLDGLPLAIELAAARLRSLSLDQLAARLDDRFRLLTGGTRTDLPRQRTLEAVVAWSYDLLRHEERAVFDRLSVFPHHFTLEMAEAVVAGGIVDELDVVEHLGRLVEKSLVTTVDVAGTLRYRLLETLRQYGQDRLVEAGDADRYRDRLLDWAVGRVVELEAVIRTPAMDDALHEAQTNAVTYRSLLDWAAFRGRQLDALRIASMVPIDANKGERRAEIVRRLADAEAGGEVDDFARGSALAAVGNLAYEQSDWEGALEAEAAAIEAFDRIGESRLAAWGRYLSVHAAWGKGEVETVDRLLAESTAAFRAESDEMGLGYALWIASLRNRDLDAAAEQAREADALFRRLRVPMGIAHNVEGRGIIALERGLLLDACRHVAEAVETFLAYENLGCAAHAMEAAAVLIARTVPDERTGPELLVAADALRSRSGQGHRPWEVRARLGTLEHLMPDLSAREQEAIWEAGLRHDLASASGLALTSLRRVAAMLEPAAGRPAAAHRSAGER